MWRIWPPSIKVQQIDIFVVAGSVVCITCFIPQINLSKAVEYVFFPG